MDGVDAIVEVPNSAIALAVQEIAKEKNRVLLVSTAAIADLTGKACSPVGVHWTWDTYAVASAAKAIVSQGGDSWFFLTADFAFGHAISLPCKPRRGSMTTRAPAAVARSTVRSLEAPSTTMTSATPCATTEATTAPIASSSPRQGMTAETMSVTPGMIALIRRDRKPASQTPAQPAIGAGRGRPIRQERGAKRLVRRPVPDVLQALLGRVP